MSAASHGRSPQLTGSGPSTDPLAQMRAAIARSRRIAGMPTRTPALRREEHDMTITHLDDPHHTDEPLAWKQAADDVFVATHAGEFAGFVTVDGRRHLAHDRHGVAIGEFASLATALAALEERARDVKPILKAAHPPRTPRPRRLSRRAIA